MEVPEESDLDSYVSFFDVQDEDDNVDPRFTIIWTTKKLLKRSNNDFHQDDATYRLVWQAK